MARHPGTAAGPRTRARPAPAGTHRGHRLLPTEGHVLPALLVSRLWGEARDHGVELRSPATVTGLSEVADGVWIELSDTIAEADAVVMAAGPLDRGTERVGRPPNADGRPRRRGHRHGRTARLHPLAPHVAGPRADHTAAQRPPGRRGPPGIARFPCEPL
ncbi:FAD-dependent oxidoreductase [Streptomyces sp. NPDC086766]|uniref:FAD-dependent oxidoreductase n=1 Tax=Streptomyces sp. NPDC086766 TaxID=3365754 RepID=UPI0038076E56